MVAVVLFGLDNFSFTISKQRVTLMVGELGVMEQKEHPWSGFAVLPAHFVKPLAPGDGPRPGWRCRKPIAAEGLAGRGVSPSIFHCLHSC